MNSLEFINQNILDCKNHIVYLENKIIEDIKYPSFVKCHKEQIEELKPILQQLEQIKAELEEYQKLKDKATPKKPERTNYMSFDPMTEFNCHCGMKLNLTYNYCPNCSQKIDWSNEE